MALFTGLSILSIITKASTWGLNYVAKKQDTEVRKLEIQAGVDIAQINASAQMLSTIAGAGTQRQTAKFNHWIFWVLICFSIGPAIATQILLFFYNWLWWSGGIWPQPWSIAEFPPQSAVWVNMSMEWLYDPVGLATSIGGSAGIAKLAGRR